ncbi:hypothetical protein QWZ06_13105 [Chryseobacterium tructae]|uniref:hypothetical protein n=1 Tax=Chryseobacterium tructae TaxID=1037380 RepID=UPI0025B31755|nr:hypothetical protein [Chryseobacterium tructae]MDN3693156.1 hypothetical protein [Chryseobacterium tructae]
MKIHNKKKYLSFLKFKRDFQKYGLEKARSYELILHWLNNRLSRNQFLVLSGILVGCTAGLAGVILKTLVHNIHYFITNKVHFEYQILFYIVFPFLGIVLTTLIVLTLFKGQDRKGIGAILYEIAQNSSIVASVKMYSQVIQSAVTVGLGGSAGLESPLRLPELPLDLILHRLTGLIIRNVPYYLLPELLPELHLHLMLPLLG